MIQQYIVYGNCQKFHIEEYTKIFFFNLLISSILISMFQTSLEQWRKVFGVTAVIGVGTYFFFQVFGTSKVQSWNYPDGKIPDEDTQPLKSKRATRRDSADFATDG